MGSSIFEIIASRRSVRHFLKRPVADNVIEDILTAGRWAPSGLNNQPWRFIVIRDKDRVNSIAECTAYGRIIQGAPVLIAVFLDRDVMYDHTKDIQACGAAIQNMLLAAHGLGLGAVWLGEILNQKEEVRQLLHAPEPLELMAVIAIGYPAGNNGAVSSRRALSEIAFLEQFGVPWKKDDT